MSATTTEITVPFPEATSDLLELRLTVGACRLELRPGDGADWVHGSYNDPTGDLPCKVTQDGARLRISQETRLRELPRVQEGSPTFDLALGRGQPYRLVIETGASDGRADLGGLPLTALTIKQGAGRLTVDFSAMNPHTMERFEVSAGASSLELRGLANSNSAEFRLEGGAASYNLDFDGQLQRDMQASVTTGVATLEIRVPASTPAKITSGTTLGLSDADEGFVRRDGGYWTTAAAQGGTPALTLRAKMALGMLRLRSTPGRLSSQQTTIATQ